MLSAARPKPQLKGEAGREEKRSERTKQAPHLKREAGRSIPVMATDLRPSAIQKAEHVHVETVVGKDGYRI